MERKKDVYSMTIARYGHSTIISLRRFKRGGGGGAHGLSLFSYVTNTSFIVVMPMPASIQIPY